MPLNPLFQKAERFIQSAELLADEGDFDSAASRLYYAMYFIAEALLASKDLTFQAIAQLFLHSVSILRRLAKWTIVFIRL
jgi:uncharacterized protein (UPF0332 family)